MSTIVGKHIMLSYAWEGGHEKVNEIAKQFKGAKIPVWMDTTNGLGPNLLDGMAKAVQESLAVCCFMTPQYQQSKYCKIELQYAFGLNIPIIPCYLTKFQPREWLGLLTAGLIFYDFSIDLNNTVLNQLIHHIQRDILKVQLTLPPTPDSVQVKIEKQPERDYIQKTAIGTNESDEAQCLLHNDSSPDLPPIQTHLKTSQNSQKTSPTRNASSPVRSSNLSKSHRNSGASRTRTVNHRSRNNGTQASQLYKDYL